MVKRFSPLRNFLARESSAGVLLLVASLLGVVIANSPARGIYGRVLSADFEIGGGFFLLKLTTLKFINYVLMTLFFFVVGLEIKRELTTGHLSRLRNAIMPFLGALGGMIFPAIIYLLIAGDVNIRGWGVPVATDIALAVGLLAIVGSSVTPALRVFLLGLAVIDDIGAILIIAFIYSSGVGVMWLSLGAAFVLFVVFMRKLGIQSLWVYILAGIMLWYVIYRSGIHSTLAGVILGLLTPSIPKMDKDGDLADGHRVTIIEWLEERLHPWTSFAILPIFAIANTGVHLTSETLKVSMTSSIAWGIFLGLFIGKPLGIALAIRLGKLFNIGDLPKGSEQGGIVATGSAAGIGFTVAIFIAHLAFQSKTEQDIAVIAVIVASMASGMMSWLLFRIIGSRKSNKTD